MDVDFVNPLTCGKIEKETRNNEFLYTISILCLSWGPGIRVRCKGFPKNWVTKTVSRIRAMNPIMVCHVKFGKLCK